jgi:hypothetical protein
MYDRGTMGICIFKIIVALNEMNKIYQQSKIHQPQIVHV